MKTDSELVSKRLMEIINERNLTINRVATLSGMHQSSVNAMFRGDSASPKLSTLRKIASGLDMSLIELLDFPPYNEVEEFH
jgi:transcriptional regulator with XRE-family HTH domain